MSDGVKYPPTLPYVKGESSPHRDPVGTTLEWRRSPHNQTKYYLWVDGKEGCFFKFAGPIEDWE